MCMRMHTCSPLLRVHYSATPLHKHRPFTDAGTPHCSTHTPFCGHTHTFCGHKYTTHFADTCTPSWRNTHRPPHTPHTVLLSHMLPPKCGHPCNYPFRMCSRTTDLVQCQHFTTDKTGPEDKGQPFPRATMVSLVSICCKTLVLPLPRPQFPTVKRGA